MNEQPAPYAVSILSMDAQYRFHDIFDIDASPGGIENV
jgi:hypothetical protein